MTLDDEHIKDMDCIKYLTMRSQVAVNGVCEWDFVDNE